MKNKMKVKVKVNKMMIKNNPAIFIMITSLLLFFYFSAASPKIIAQENLPKRQPQNKSIQIINPLFGPEFTFTNNELIEEEFKNPAGSIRTEKTQKYLNLWRKKMLEICQIKKCQEIKQLDRYQLVVYKYLYPNGFYYTLTTDPQVIEITMKPLTIDEVSEQAKTIEDDIFHLAKSIGLTPHEYFGGGSIHMDVASAFGEDSDLFMDFFIDYANHYYLSMVSMGSYLDNAPPVLKLPAMNINSMRMIHQLHQLHQNHQNKKLSINELSGMIIRNVYKSTYLENFYPPQKYQALNLDKIIQNNPAHRTVEIRGIRAQESVEEYIKILRIFRARVNYLNLRRKYGLPPVQLLPTIPEYGTELFNYTSNDPINQLYHYIKESGLNWQEFEFLKQRIENNSLHRYYNLKPLRETPGCLSQQDRRLGQPEEMIKNFLQLRAKL